MHIALATAIALGAMTIGLMSPAQAGPDGSRQPAGGAHMSSYVHHPNHDPRSVYWQRRGSGQILGQPMFSEGAGAHHPYRARRNTPNHWASGLYR